MVLLRRPGARTILAERRRLLGLRNRLEGIAWKVADQYERRLDQDGWEPGVRDLVSIMALVEKLTVTGAGLPKEHRVEVDDHGEVVANRAQMKAMEQKVRELRERARVNRRGPYAPQAADSRRNKAGEEAA